MTGKELTDEELQEIADTYGLYTEQDVENRVSCELLRIGARNEDLEKENAELKEELKKWKDEWQEQVQKENNESYARTLQTIQLNKAKKIISNLYAICKDNHYPNTSVLMEQAEQFLKECE